MDSNIGRSWVVVFTVFFKLTLICAVENLSLFPKENPVYLPNEQCKPRPTLIEVGEGKYNYFPLMISLYRCGGIVGTDKPSFRKCSKDNYTNIYLLAFNDINRQNETLVFENHTSCKSECVHDSSVCTSTQMWNPNTCQCICAKSISEVCPENYNWNPNLCICECEIFCNKRQLLNATGCSCYCQARYYRRCNKQNKFIQETDCKCYLPEALLGENSCNILPTKWAVIIIIVSFCAIFVCAFDVILYARRTGCLYISTHLCDKKHQEERTPIKIHKNSILTVESTT